MRCGVFFVSVSRWYYLPCVVVLLRICRWIPVIYWHQKFGPHSDEYSPNCFLTICLSSCFTTVPHASLLQENPRALSFKSPWWVKERLTKEHICKKTFLHHWCTCHFHISFFYDIDRATWIYISYGQQKTFYVNKMHAISDVKLSKVQVLNSRRATILIDY